MTNLGLDTAGASQGFELIPIGEKIEVTAYIQPGGVGDGGLLKRSAKGDCEGVNIVYIIQGGKFHDRKIFHFHILEGTTAGHVKAGEITRSILRAIFEAVNNIDPLDVSPTTVARRASVSLADFHGATFLAEVTIERGKRKPDGSTWPDRNLIGKVLRPGDTGYRQLVQPPKPPLDPVDTTSASATGTNGGSPTVVTTPAAIAKPAWAQ